MTQGNLKGQDKGEKFDFGITHTKTSLINKTLFYKKFRTQTFKNTYNVTQYENRTWKGKRSCDGCGQFNIQIRPKNRLNEISETFRKTQYKTLIKNFILSLFWVPLVVYGYNEKSNGLLTIGILVGLIVYLSNVFVFYTTFFGKYIDFGLGWSDHSIKILTEPNNLKKNINPILRIVGFFASFAIIFIIYGVFFTMLDLVI